MKKIKKILPILFVISLIFSTNVFAARQTIYLPSNQNFVNQSAIRSGRYSTVATKCFAVYPPSGTDNYQYIQVRVVNDKGVQITPIITLKEGNALSYISIYEGYLTLENITFQFRGNNPKYDAYADVFYSGM